MCRLPWEIIVIRTVNGLVTGMILALVASGLTLIFGIMDVVNVAHGELFMLVPLSAWSCSRPAAASGSRLGSPHLLLPCSVRRWQVTTLRPLLGRDPLNTILATFGFSLVLQNYALWQFGPVPRRSWNLSQANSRSSTSYIPGTGC